MLVVDASCLYTVLTGAVGAEQIRERLSSELDQCAPHVVDVEVMNVVRRDLFLGRLDPTAAEQAVEDLADWPAERFGHRSLLARAWELRDNVRGWDAFYVALAEALDATLLTCDARLSRVPGLPCRVEVPVGGA